MIAPSDLEGGFTLRLRLQGDHRIASASLHSDRPLIVTRALIGQAPEDAVRLTGRLFPICGLAQTAAALGALEAAIGLEASEAQARARELVVAGEMAQSHAWRICIDWADLTGEARDLQAIAELRRHVAEIARQVFGRTDWAQIGGCPLCPDIEALDANLAAIGTWLQAHVLGDRKLPQTVADVEAWAGEGANLPARLVALARGPEFTDLTGEFSDLMTSRDPHWFATRLSSDPNFSARPSLDGAPCETGAFADRAHPLARPLIAAWGPGLAVRFALQALDAAALAEDMTRRLNELAQAEPSSEPAPREPRAGGEGCAIAETVRGPVAHWARLEDHCIVDYRTVAPSEWNFHPEGPLVQALTGTAPAAGPERMARMIGAALDPCAPLRIVIDREDTGPADA